MKCSELHWVVVESNQIIISALQRNTMLVWTNLYTVVKRDPSSPSKLSWLQRLPTQHIKTSNMEQYKESVYLLWWLPNNMWALGLVLTHWWNQLVQWSRRMKPLWCNPQCIGCRAITDNQWFCSPQPPCKIQDYKHDTQLRTCSGCPATQFLTLNSKYLLVLR